MYIYIFFLTELEEMFMEVLSFAAPIFRQTGHEKQRKEQQVQKNQDFLSLASCKPDWVFLAVFFGYKMLMEHSVTLTVCI